MGDLPLSLGLIARRARTVSGLVEVKTADRGGIRTSTWSEIVDRAARWDPILTSLGVRAGGVVASLAWSTSEHVELYLGVPCARRVLHTLNPRFAVEALVAVIAESGAEVLVAPSSLGALAVQLTDAAPSIRHLIEFADTPEPVEPPMGGQVHELESLLADCGRVDLGDVTDERSPAMICHTGGTTGLPKGVVYSHRSLVLHAMAVTAAGGIGIAPDDVVMPIVPMFHANAVGFIHAAALVGCPLVLPGSDLSGPALATLLEEQAVTVTNGVPTVWTSVLPHLENRSLPALRRVISGASAVPPVLSDRFREATGLPLTQIWGMTETSPFATINRAIPTVTDLETDGVVPGSVGLPVPGLEVRVIDESGREVNAGSGVSGELQVRGPWVTIGYLGGRTASSVTDDGWLRTGDLVVRNEVGFIQIVDRLKDVIKSGGEWISSVELENHLIGHDSVAEVAVVGVPDEQWGERPVACVVLAGGHRLDRQALESHLMNLVPSWWIPTRFEEFDAIPRTAVGKADKPGLRAELTRRET